MFKTKSILLKAERIKRTYKSADELLTIFDNLSFTINQGELLSIVGASGAGKSTLLHILGGLDRPTFGDVEFLGTFLWKLSSIELANFRNQKIGFVFQFHYLLPEFSALENIQIPMLINGKTHRESLKRAMELLSYVELESRANHYPSELSGGESQRVALARALANDPILLLADEPTGNLDERTGENIFSLLRQLHNTYNLTSILVTHNMSLANSCDYVLNLEHGQLTRK